MVVRNLIIIFLLLFSNGLLGQIAVTNAPPFDTEQYIVNNVLLGDDLQTSNWSWQNGDTNIGYFDGNNANIGFEEGIVMSTGGINFVVDGNGVGSGITGDDDLETALTALGMTGFSVNNVTILEFDFIANSESVSFNYVFGSMEYTSFTCSSFNDVFGFFLSGPGINGPYTNGGVNIALVPDPEGALDYQNWLNINTGIFTTTPVAVNTVNNGEMTDDPQCNDLDPDFEDYNVFWVDNDYVVNDWQGVNQPSIPENTVQGVTGFTTPLQAQYNGLVCGETYHIKLAIADCADGILNSAVFLEANSFVSPSVEVFPIPNIDGPELFDDEFAIYEGCAAAQLEFTASGNNEYDIELEVSFDGQAEYGIDYIATDLAGNELSIVDTIIIPVGEEFFYLNLISSDDNSIENFETIDVEINAVEGVCQQADLTLSSLSFNLYDQIPIEVLSNNAFIECLGDQALLEPVVSGGYIGNSNSYSFEWLDQNGDIFSTDSIVLVTTELDAVFTLLATDDCGDQEIATDFQVQVADYSDLTINYPDYYACDNDILMLEAEISGGSENYSNYTWQNSIPCDDCSSYEFVFDLDNGISQNVNLSVVDACTQELFSFQIPVNLADQPSISMEDLDYIVCDGDIISLEPVLMGGSNNYLYAWQDEELCNDCPTYDFLFNLDYGSSQNANLSVIDACTQEAFEFQIPISLDTQSEIDIIYPLYIACDGDEVLNEPVVSGGSGDYLYIWPDSSEPCTCSTHNFTFSLDNTQNQTNYVNMSIVDACTLEEFPFQIPVFLDNPPSPDIEISQISSQFCPGDEVVLSSSLNEGSSDYSYNWINLDIDESQSDDGQFATVSPINDYVYALEVEDLCNQELDTFYYNMIIPTYLPPTFNVFDVSGCIGEEVELEVQNLNASGVVDSGDLSQYTFLWSTEETTPTITVEVQESVELYTVEVGDLCGNISVPQSISVSSIVVPDPVFTSEQVEQNTIQFTQLNADDFISFDWDFGDGNSSVEENPIHIYSSDGDFYVYLEAIDAFGCKNNYNGLINIFTSLMFYSPDVFSPNGDGVNDTFKVSIVGHDDFELFVFDRWGKELFHSLDPDEGWNGKYANGQDVPQDVYMYKAIMSNQSVGEKIQQGKVSIIK